ncbi:hypothetical protein C8J56DRAFT_321871 [Mycena floridula]|nr:hypothetical protein C8J56DRAFT_321871 [Mycena floridula]
MNQGRRVLSSKYESTYSKLFQGTSPQQINPNEDPNRFWSNLLTLEVNREFLDAEFGRLSKDSLMGHLKPVVNELFSACLKEARFTGSNQVRASHALETMCIVTRCVFAKNPTGFETMSILAGGVNQSDKLFMDLASFIEEGISDPSVPVSIRHQTIQLAVIFMCGVAQMSPGAYFLRRDLFPSIAAFIKSPDTERYTFEAILLLGVLANFHKSDAAKMNPYLQRMKDTTDKVLMRKICWAANYSLDASVKAFQDLANDDISPSLASTLGSVFAAMRPDRALATAPLDRELFKNQPIEATVVLLPLYEFIRTNPTFSVVLLEYIFEDNLKTQKKPPPQFTILTISSYLLTHATSLSSSRSIAYANLALSSLLALVENEQMLASFCQPTSVKIRLCRQRVPLLPIPRSNRPPLGALLDCCVIWLRHNLHLRLEVALYTNCVWICYRVVWYLQQHRIRLEYEWKELFIAILGLLSFITTKLDSLVSTGGIELLLREAIVLLNLLLAKSEVFLPRPRALHELVYELVRSSSVIQELKPLLSTLTVPRANPRSWETTNPADLLGNIIEIAQFYENIVLEAGGTTAEDASLAVAQHIEKDGLHGIKDNLEIEPIKRTEDVLGFSRFACMDGLSLLA